MSGNDFTGVRKMPKTHFNIQDQFLNQVRKARIKVEVEVALALLDLLVLVAQDLDLAAQPGDLGVERLDLAQQLHHADVADALLELSDALGGLPGASRLLGADLVDALPRDLVVEESRVRAPRGEEQQDGGGKAPAIHPRT